MQFDTFRQRTAQKKTLILYENDELTISESNQNAGSKIERLYKSAINVIFLN